MVSRDTKHYSPSTASRLVLSRPWVGGNKPRGPLATRTHRKRVRGAITPCNELIRGTGTRTPLRRREAREA